MTSWIHKDGHDDALFQLKSDSLPHAHAQTTKTYYKGIEDSRNPCSSRIKANTNTNSDYTRSSFKISKSYQWRLLASFQDDAKYEHVGQDTRSQGGKDDQDGRIKI
ncbi:hypothetical protein Tco_0716156 [Tanacetum coccineum]